MFSYFIGFVPCENSVDHRSCIVLSGEVAKSKVCFISTSVITSLFVSLQSNYLHFDSFRSLSIGSGDDKQAVLSVTFRARDLAEAAVRMFPKFRGRQLVMSFTPPSGFLNEENSPTSKTAASDARATELHEPKDSLTSPTPMDEVCAGVGRSAFLISDS